MQAVVAQDRFNAARPEIERQPCLKPLRTTVWTTVEDVDRAPNKGWRDMTNGVFWLTFER